MAQDIESDEHTAAFLDSDSSGVTVSDEEAGMSGDEGIDQTWHVETETDTMAESQCTSELNTTAFTDIQSERAEEMSSSKGSNVIELDNLRRRFR